MSLYPTRQPITNAGIEAWCAERIAKRFPNGNVPRTARLNVKVKAFTAAGHAAIVEQMSEDMRMFGDGMTEQDLKRLGYTAEQIKHCAKAAGDRALARAHLN